MVLHSLNFGGRTPSHFHGDVCVRMRVHGYDCATENTACERERQANRQKQGEKKRHGADGHTKTHRKTDRQTLRVRAQWKLTWFAFLARSP